MHPRNSDQSLINAVVNLNDARVFELIAARANVNAVAPENQLSALMHAVTRKRLVIVRALHSAGAVVNVKDHMGFTPLMNAAVSGRLDIVQFLLEQGAFYETRNNYNETAAMMARYNRYAETTATFLESLPAPFRGPQTLQEARAAGRLAPGIARAFPEEPDQMIRQRDIDLTVAARTGNEARFHELLRAGAHINAFDDYGVPVLVQAATGGNINIVRFLLDQPETNINAGCALWNNTALMRAVCEGHLTIVELLLERGAMVNVVNLMGNTALIMLMSSSAERRVHLEIKRLLLNAGANPEHIDDQGISAAHLARQNSQSDPLYHVASPFQEQKIPPPPPARHPEEKTVSAAAPPKKPSTFQERLAEINYEGPIPEEFLCPVSYEFINDPVAASSGIFYDRSSLIHYFESNKDHDKLLCPVTKSFFISKKELESQPNVYFKNRLNDFVTEKEKAHAEKKKAVAAPPPPPTASPSSDPGSPRAAHMGMFATNSANSSSEENPSHGNPARGFKKG
ncbi:MAG TPA: ankyrin repeat domain-containing protein [Gammaproteobacteria bacterium]|nr:ankyrin repeat domain-containing protein [Gammaproteobacteria bacterium]